ncbi:IS3 family transposase [Pseudoxanthobacter sp. M-2]|uniref:IS3 family transposase n=1 Tax=Pseudoxanthobacter sp. M-2 TaxID=3078754 RepID=UPI0038FD3B9D
MTKKANTFSPEVRARAVRMVLEHEGDHTSRWAAIASIAAKIGCTGETLRLWLKKAERDGDRSGSSAADLAARLKALERENRELRQANEILRQASAYFCPGGARPPTQVMTGFIDDHRGVYGIEPICRVLPIAPSTYHAHVARRADPSKSSARTCRDSALRGTIRRVFDDNFRVYGVRKVWRQMKREGESVARCAVTRLMKDLGLRGVIRGRPVKTTVSNRAKPCPLDRVNRQFRAPRPNAMWLSDVTYVATWSGFAYVAFVIDAFARRIVGWRASRTARATLVLDALEQALHARRPSQSDGLVHHSNRGVQYISIRYTERLAEAGVLPSVGSVRDSYDNALAETINGLYKTEVIHRRGPWRSFEAVEYATLDWVDWLTNRRLLEPIGNIPPAEAESRWWAGQEQATIAA